LTEQESAPSLSTRATLKLGGCGGCLPREDAPVACASNLPFHMWPMPDARRCPTIAAWRYDFTAFNDFDAFSNFNDANDFNNFNDPNDFNDFNDLNDFNDFTDFKFNGFNDFNDFN